MVFSTPLFAVSKHPIKIRPSSNVKTRSDYRRTDLCHSLCFKHEPTIISFRSSLFRYFVSLFHYSSKRSHGVHNVGSLLHNLGGSVWCHRLAIMGSQDGSSPSYQNKADQQQDVIIGGASTGGKVSSNECYYASGARDAIYLVLDSIIDLGLSDRGLK